MKQRIQYADDDELPQDRMQGAEDNEWVGETSRKYSVPDTDLFDTRFPALAG